MSLTPGEIQSFAMALADACTLDELQILVTFAVGKTIDRYVPRSATFLLPCVPRGAGGVQRRLGTTVAQ